MNAPTTIPAPAPSAVRPQRADGWTPDRRTTFLAALAEGHTVEAACRHVALSPASAYALRRRNDLFAIGWNAACLLAREALADMLMSRAIDGQVDTYTRADGQQVTRHRFDNRLGQAMLARLDRLAEVPPAGTAQPLDAGETRAAACAFPTFLGLIEDDADGPEINAFLDAFTPRTSQLPQLSPDAEQEIEHEMEEDEELGPADPVWFDEDEQEWRTEFPPPAGFRGKQHGEYGDEDYRRSLTKAEQAKAERDERERQQEAREEDERTRDEWLGR